MRPKEEPGVGDIDINDLLNRESYKPEAEVPEQQLTMYSSRQVGHDSKLRYTEEEDAISYGDMTSEGSSVARGTAGTHPPAALWASNRSERRGFLLMTKHTGAGLVPGLEQSLSDQSHR